MEEDSKIACQNRRKIVDNVSKMWLYNTNLHMALAFLVVSRRVGRKTGFQALFD